jgi:hypothetical protein
MTEPPTTLLTSAPNEFVADIILQRLAEGGVRARPIGRLAGPTPFAVGRVVEQDIYVEDGDLQRAREILRDAESAGEELA